MGTIEEYGNSESPFSEDTIELPISSYGLSKLSTTKLALLFNRNFHLPVIVFRASIAYGPEQGEEMFIPAMIKSLLRREDFMMTQGSQLRDFLYISDLIDALLEGIQCKKIEGQVLNIASGNSTKLRNVAIQGAQILDAQKYLQIGSLPLRNFEIMNYSVNISKVTNQLEWRPSISLEKGLTKTIKYYQSNL